MARCSPAHAVWSKEGGIQAWREVWREVWDGGVGQRPGGGEVHSEIGVEAAPEDARISKEDARISKEDARISK